MKNMIRTTIAAALALLVNVSAKDLKPEHQHDHRGLHGLASSGRRPSMAMRIDSARKVAPLTSCEDLDKVKGIGPPSWRSSAPADVLTIPRMAPRNGPAPDNPA